MSPAKRIYEPRIFEGRVMLPDLEWMPAWVYGAGWSLQAVSRILGLASTRAGAARSSSIGNPTLPLCWRRTRPTYNPL
jgi:hypothetical protein